MRRRPVRGILRDNEDRPVETHLLAVVLPDMRVVPVSPRIRELEAVLEPLADCDRLLRRVRAVVAVVQPYAVPVHGGLEIALVLDVDDDARALPDLEDRPRHRAVVREHPHLVLTQA